MVQTLAQIQVRLLGSCCALWHFGHLLLFGFAAAIAVMSCMDVPNPNSSVLSVGDYRAALRLIRPVSASWPPEVIAASARNGDGLDQVWDAVLRHRDALTAGGEKAARRGEQAQAALWADLGDRLLEALKRRPEIARRLPEIEAEVRSGTLMPMTGARLLLELFGARTHN